MASHGHITLRLLEEALGSTPSKDSMIGFTIAEIAGPFEDMTSSRHSNSLIIKPGKQGATTVEYSVADNWKAVERLERGTLFGTPKYDKRPRCDPGSKYIYGEKYTDEALHLFEVS